MNRLGKYRFLTILFMLLSDILLFGAIATLLFNKTDFTLITYNVIVILAATGVMAIGGSILFMGLLRKKRVQSSLADPVSILLPILLAIIIKPVFGYALNFFRTQVWTQNITGSIPAGYLNVLEWAGALYSLSIWFLAIHIISKRNSQPDEPSTGNQIDRLTDN